MPSLVGHTLTYVGDNKLVLIGGFSSRVYFSNKVYEYDTNGGLLAWREYPPEKMEGAIPIGQSRTKQMKARGQHSSYLLI